MKTPSLTCDQLDASAHNFTPKGFHAVRLKTLSREYEIPLPEVRRLESEISTRDLHWQLIQKAVAAGAVMRRQVLDSLPEDGRYYLSKFYPACIPEGYLAPAIRAKNTRFEAEIRQARKPVAA